MSTSRNAHRRFVLPILAALALAPFATLAACGGSVGNSIAASCVTGAQTECACFDGSRGVQVCDKSGSYGACACGFGAGSASGSGRAPGSGSGDPGVTSPPHVAGPADDVSGCAGTANVMVFDGDPDDYIHPGYEKILGSLWSAAPSMAHDTLSFDIEPAAGQKWLWWSPELHSPQMSGPLVVGPYLNASRAAFTSPLQPGLDINGDGRGCNTISGSFWIHEIAWSGDALAHVLLAFEQHCEDGPSKLRGCIGFTAAPDAGAPNP